MKLWLFSFLFVLILIHVGDLKSGIAELKGASGKQEDITNVKIQQLQVTHADWGIQIADVERPRVIFPRFVFVLSSAQFPCFLSHPTLPVRN